MKQNVDVSSFSATVAAMTTTATSETKAEIRRQQLREAKKRQREGLRAGGGREVQIRIGTMEEYETIRAAKAMYQGDPDEFLARALVVGAKFLANSGNRKGGKVRLK